MATDRRSELKKCGLFRIASLKTAEHKQVCTAISAAVGEDCADAFIKELLRELNQTTFEKPPVVVGGAKKEKKPTDNYHTRKFLVDTEEDVSKWEREYVLTNEDLMEFEHIRGLKPYSQDRVWSSVQETEVTAVVFKLLTLKTYSPYPKQNYLAAEKICSAVTKKMGQLARRKGRTDFSLLNFISRKASNVIQQMGQTGKHVSLCEMRLRWLPPYHTYIAVAACMPLCAGRTLFESQNDHARAGRTPKDRKARAAGLLRSLGGGSPSFRPR